jgi:hypothetical protein
MEAVAVAGHAEDGAGDLHVLQMLRGLDAPQGELGRFWLPLFWNQDVVEPLIKLAAIEREPCDRGSRVPAIARRTLDRGLLDPAKEQEPREINGLLLQVEERREPPGS